VRPFFCQIALKLATGAGKTTVMAMLMAWQTVNAVRHPASKQFTRGFLIVAPGLTIKDRLRVLLPQDPESCYGSREIVPGDMLGDIKRAVIVINDEAHHCDREKPQDARSDMGDLKGDEKDEAKKNNGAAVNGRAQALVSFNRRGFADAPARFGVLLATPGQFLRSLDP
jgi:type III restriction enzyme